MDLGASEGNRTPVSCLEGRCSTIELHRQIGKGTRGDLNPPLWERIPLVLRTSPSDTVMKATRSQRQVNLVLVGHQGIEPWT